MQYTVMYTNNFDHRGWRENRHPDGRQRKDRRSAVVELIEEQRLVTANYRTKPQFAVGVVVDGIARLETKEEALAHQAAMEVVDAKLAKLAPKKPLRSGDLKPGQKFKYVCGCPGSEPDTVQKADSDFCNSPGRGCEVELVEDKPTLYTRVYRRPDESKWTECTWGGDPHRSTNLDDLKAELASYPYPINDQAIGTLDDGKLTVLPDTIRPSTWPVWKFDVDFKTVWVTAPSTATDYKVKTAAKKAPLAMVPAAALTGAARVYQYGAKKYAAGNFYNANLDDGAGSRYVGAALRHLSEMQHPNGLHTPESLASRDDESGLPHIDHAICSLLMLRSIMTKNNALPTDPGEGNEPPKETK